ncbi:MAG: hypothetical protein MZW92_21850 [Comamonadaceae bacterium]|nr:hypothetical protein [Comamonadaceae bacterium]
MLLIRSRSHGADSRAEPSAAAVFIIALQSCAWRPAVLVDSGDYSNIWTRRDMGQALRHFLLDAFVRQALLLAAVVLLPGCG